jgi:hypothetical protein
MDLYPKELTQINPQPLIGLCYFQNLHNDIIKIINKGNIMKVISYETENSINIPKKKVKIINK